ncbi:MAG: ABC transporter substrate-binding protein [Clostridiaceae bacterium]|nr:ABC transporter substrate-binding protein [Clostridiaceae bacterium]
MSKLTKLLSVLLVLTLLTFTVAGCQQEEEEKTSLTIAINGDIDNFDPFTQQLNLYIRLIANNCMEPLFYLNGDMEYEMALATEYEQIDELNYTFKLREGVKFHNGEAFTADDVKYTIEYAMDEANASYRATYFSTVESIECPDDYTVNIKLTDPTPAFLDAIAAQVIVCKSVDAATFETKPIGTGAFKFVSWTPNDNITFEKYADYWDVAKVKVDQLILKPFADQSVSMTNLEAGSIDMIYELQPVNTATVSGKDNQKIIQPATSNSMTVYEIGRHNFEPFSDPDVLNAMFMAFDKETIAQEVYYGNAKAAKSVFPEGAKFYKAVDDITFDPAAAASLLAGTDYADGFEFDLLILSGDTANEQIATIWQAELAKLNIKMNLKVSELSVWLDAYLGRTYDLIANAYSMVGSDPATCCAQIIAPLLDHQAADIPDLGTLIETGKGSADEAVRNDAYSKIQDLLIQYKPVYFTMVTNPLFAAKENLNGIEVNGMGHLILKAANFS